MKYEAKKIQKILEKIGEEIESTIYAPNCGGCGFIAYIVAKKLKRIGVECEVVSVGRKKDNSPLNALKLASASGDYTTAIDAVTSFNHLAVRFKADGKLYIWDSEGIYKGGKYFGPKTGIIKRRWTASYPFGEGFKPHQAEKVVKAYEDWNSMFDQSQVPKIKKIVDKIFAEV